MGTVHDIKGRTLISTAETKTPAGRILYAALLTLLFIGTLAAVIPFLWLFVGGLKRPKRLPALPHPVAKGSPLDWGWGNYLESITTFKILKYFSNTLVLIVGVWFFQIATSSLAGYALAKLRVPFAKLFLLLFLARVLVPFETIMIPLYLTVKELPGLHWILVQMFGSAGGTGFLHNLGTKGLLDSYWGIILPSSVSAFNIFLFRGFFMSIPSDLIEAARIDGCSEMGIFSRVVAPLSMPIFAVVSIFSGLATWNSFIWPYLVLSDQSKYPIMVRLYYLFENPETTYNILLATLFICSLPPIVLFFIFQKQIVRGITLTGLKG
jgi:multiple sugar transport system permease protein